MDVFDELNLMRLTHMINEKVKEAQLLAEFIPYEARCIINLKAGLKQAAIIADEANELARGRHIITYLEPRKR